MSNIYVHNPHATNTINYQGQDILAGEYFLIPSSKHGQWQSDSALLVDIANGVVVISSDESSGGHIYVVNDAIDYLKGNEIRKFTQTAIEDPNGLRARLKGTHFDTAVKNTSTPVDWKIEQLQWPIGTNVDSIFNGVQYFAENATMGDTLTFQVIDKADGGTSQGVALGLYSQAVYDMFKDQTTGEFIVEQFGDPWYVAPNSLEDIILYKAKLIPTLYIRVIYTNVNTTTDTVFFCNLFRHIEA
jgi:hypothetical protein